jgi:YihY family inner membrane protein
VILSHDNDPIAVFGPDLLVQRPWWLADGRRGRGVPPTMRWQPLVTFVQTAMDAANAMVSVPGKFGSFGHDYRADMVRFVQDGYQLPAASEPQLDRLPRQDDRPLEDLALQGGDAEGAGLVPRPFRDAHPPHRRRPLAQGPAPGDRPRHECGAVHSTPAGVNRIEGLLRAVDRFQQRHTLLGFPVGVVKKFGDDQAGKHAALLAYYGFMSLFPLLLVFVTVLGYVLANDEELRQRVIDALVSQFPVLGRQIEDSVTTIQGSGVGLVVGIVGTLWGGLGITQSAQDAMNAVWNIPRKDRPNYWFRLARGLGSLLVLVVAVFAATALAQLGRITPGVGGRLLSFTGSLLLNLLLLIALFQVLTGMWVPWRRLLPGAVCGGIGWSALQTLGVYIVDRQLERTNLIYGVFAVVIVLLSWLYLSAQLLLYAAEVNVVLARRLWPRSLLQPPLTGPDRRVLTALAQAEERRPEQRIEVSFAPEPDGEEGPPPPPPAGPGTR